MGILTDFTLSLLNLAVFRHYVQPFLKPRDISSGRQAALTVLTAGAWAAVNRLGNYHYGMLCSAAALGITACFFHGKILLKAAVIAVFMAAGTAMEPLGSLLQGTVCRAGEAAGRCSYTAAAPICFARAGIF